MLPDQSPARSVAYESGVLFLFLLFLLLPLAARKNLTVKEGLTAGRWIRGLHRLVTEIRVEGSVKFFF